MYKWLHDQYMWHDKTWLTLASITPDNKNDPITNIIVPTTHSVTARRIAYLGNFGGGFWNYNKNLLLVFIWPLTFSQTLQICSGWLRKHSSQKKLKFSINERRIIELTCVESLAKGEIVHYEQFLHLLECFWRTFAAKESNIKGCLWNKNIC